MNARQKELLRLKAYARGLGLTVRIKPYKPMSRDSATHFVCSDGTAEIVIYKKNKDSDLTTILSLIHEIAHQKYFIYKGRRFKSAADEEVQSRTYEGRKDLLLYELRSTQYWKDIYTDTGCTFPIWRLYLAMEEDLWQYRFLLKKGRYPTVTEIKEASKKIKKRHKRGH